MITMRQLIPVLMVLATPAPAQDFSEGSQAKSWNLYAEQPALFQAQVVDVLCELTGDCPENCGGGDRQLGLVRAADDVLVLPNKNGQAAFNGAVAELLPFCGAEVEVDGLLIDDPDLGAVNIYQVQLIRRVGDTEWTKADSWTKVWAEKNPEAAGKGPWYRRDPRVKAAIAKDGYFGLGLEKDKDIKELLFE